VLTQELYGSGNKIQYAETASILNGGTTASASGTSAVATVTAMVSRDGSTQAYSAAFTGSSAAAGNGLQIQDNHGNNILLTESGGTTSIGTATVMATASGSNMQFQIGSFSGQAVSMGLMNTQTGQLGQSVVAGKSLKDIDVTTAQGAADAIKILDQAISQVSTQRAQIGAFQKNTLDSTIKFLAVGIQNLSASASQIRDADVASEVVNMTKNQILQQAGTSVLRTSNQAPQMVLSLLQ
jgi:flagellin